MDQSSSEIDVEKRFATIPHEQVESQYEVDDEVPENYLSSEPPLRQLELGATVIDADEYYPDYNLNRSDDIDDDMDGGDFNLDFNFKSYKPVSTFDNTNFEEDYSSSRLEHLTTGLFQANDQKFQKSMSDSLEEELLPNPADNSFLVGAKQYLANQKQKFKDYYWLVFYIVVVIIWSVVNLVVIIKSSQSSLVAKYAGLTVYRAIKDSIGAVVVSIIISIVVGLSFLTTLICFVKPLVWLTFLSVPVVSLVLFLWMLTRGIIGFDFELGSPSTLSRAFSLLPLAIGGLQALLIHRYHHKISHVVAIIQMASQVLRKNVELVSVALLTIACHMLFSAIWLISFDRLFLLGQLQPLDPTKDAYKWVTDPSLSYLVPFYVLFYTWTTGIINNIERATIAGTVSQWYFHQNAHSDGFTPTRIALRRALTTSAGSLVLGSLIMAVVNTIKLLREAYQNRNRGSGPVRTCINLIFTPILMAATYIEGISLFTISYVGISGKPFLQSARLATTILARDFLTSLMTNFILRLTLYSAILSASGITSYSFFTFSADTLHTSHPLIVATLGLGVPMVVLKFILNLLIYTTDAVYLCYGIDLDQNTVHNALAHRTLSQGITGNNLAMS